LPNNKVILTGDIHSSWANDVATPSYDAGSHTGSAAVEFVGPSVTSPSLELGWAEDAIQLMNEHIKFIDIEHRGIFNVGCYQRKNAG
jgi:alkaline phosphatase D